MPQEKFFLVSSPPRQTWNRLVVSVVKVPEMPRWAEIVPAVEQSQNFRAVETARSNVEGQADQRIELVLRKRNMRLAVDFCLPLRRGRGEVSARLAFCLFRWVPHFV
jgi:hypothetical protein